MLFFVFHERWMRYLWCGVFMTLAALHGPARDLLLLLRAKSLQLALAESCTGGLACAALTDIAGSSDVLERGFVTYSNASKADMLGVDAEIIERFGAVSEEVALLMAQGALERSRAGVGASITGIAGPSGGSEQKPVGLVYFAVCVAGKSTLSGERRFGDLGRHKARVQGVLALFALISRAVSTSCD